MGWGGEPALPAAPEAGGKAVVGRAPRRFADVARDVTPSNNFRSAPILHSQRIASE
jgi:hypothetical protein